jgi:hypothetical protein
MLNTSLLETYTKQVQILSKTSAIRSTPASTSCRKAKAEVRPGQPSVLFLAPFTGRTRTASPASSPLPRAVARTANSDARERTHKPIAGSILFHRSLKKIC